MQRPGQPSVTAAEGLAGWNTSFSWHGFRGPVGTGRGWRRLWPARVYIATDLGFWRHMVTAGLWKLTGFRFGVGASLDGTESPVKRCSRLGVWDPSSMSVRENPAASGGAVGVTREQLEVELDELVTDRRGREHA